MPQRTVESSVEVIAARTNLVAVAILRWIGVGRLQGWELVRVSAVFAVWQRVYSIWRARGKAPQRSNDLIPDLAADLFASLLHALPGYSVSTYQYLIVHYYSSTRVERGILKYCTVQPYSIAIFCPMTA